MGQVETELVELEDKLKQSESQMVKINVTPREHSHSCSVLFSLFLNLSHKNISRHLITVPL